MTSPEEAAAVRFARASRPNSVPRVARSDYTALTPRNLLSYIRKRSVDFALLFGLAILLLTFLDFRSLKPTPLSYSDLTVPFLYGGWASYLSSASPYYPILARLAFGVAPGNYGYILNATDVYSYAVAPLAVYALLDQLRLSRLARIGGGLFLLANPFTLQLAQGYLEYSTFWIAAPLIIALLLRYNLNGARRDVYCASLLTFLLLQLNPVDGLRLIAPVTLGFWALPFLSRKHPVASVAKDTLGALGTLLVVSVLGAVFTGGIGSVGYWISSGSNSGSSLYQFTVSQISYTFQGQSFLNSLTMVTVYPGSAMKLANYVGSWPWVLWVATLGASLLAPATLALDGRARLREGFTILLVTLLCLISYEVGVWSGVVGGLFRHLPFLLEYEYPDVIHLIEVVIYSVFFGALVELAPKWGGWTVSRLRAVLLRSRSTANAHADSISHSSPLSARGSWGHNRAKSRIPGIIQICVVAAVLLLPTVPFFEPSWGGNLNPTRSAANYLPGYYSQIGEYLQSRVGGSRVLPLPLNYSTIIDLYSVVPVGHIFGIPYAGVNNPLAYPTVTATSRLISAIQSANKSALSGLLSVNNIQFIVVVNEKSRLRITIEPSRYNPYLDGGGALFNSLLNGTSNVSLVDEAPGFTIYRNDQYSSPIVQPASFYTYTSSLNDRPSLSTSVGLLTGSNLTSRSDWGQWTSCSGPESNFISYGPGGAQLDTCTLDQTFTGIRSQTEIYQWVNLSPDENISVRGNLTVTGPTEVRLIVIYHNASNLNLSRSFYTENQTFPIVAPDPNGSFQFQFTSPPDALGGVFGIQDFGVTEGKGGIATIHEFNVFREFSYLKAYRPASFPFPPNAALALPQSNQTDAISTLAGQVTTYAPANTLTIAETSELSDNPATGTAYLPAGSWTLEVLCPARSARELYALIQQLNSSATVSDGVAPSYPLLSGWNQIPFDCVTSMTNLTVNISGTGAVALMEIQAWSPPPPSSVPRVSVTAQSSLGDGYVVSSSQSGVVVLILGQNSQAEHFRDSTLLSQVITQGISVWIVTFSPSGSFIVVLRGIAIVETGAIAYNLTLFIAGGILLGVAVSSRFRGLLTRGRR